MDQSQGLTEHTRSLLNELYPRGTGTRQLAEDSGLGMRWIMRFREGEFPNPGVANIQTLYEALTGKRLVA